MGKETDKKYEVMMHRIISENTDDSTFPKVDWYNS